jgi:hypothetical protein
MVRDWLRVNITTTIDDPCFGMVFFDRGRGKLATGDPHHDIVRLRPSDRGPDQIGSVVGLVVWLVERRHNEHFGGGVTKGISTGVWW